MGRKVLVAYASKRGATKEIAEKIRSGEIDVGDDYTMAESGRYHTIHSEILGLDHETCHIGDEFTEDYLDQRKYKVPVRDAPGVVDRRICISCHTEGGPAGELFETAEK